MRKIIDMQMKIGELAIKDIEFDLRSRDEIPELLMGLQSIYCNREVRDRVFEVLLDIVPDDVDPNNGRSGMDLWKILVLGTMRLSCNWDYDKLLDIANNHRTLRLMLGHNAMDFESRYALQTLKDNVCLFIPEVLDKINQITVKYGHEVIGKKAEEGIRASCDSFVLETDVHYPTDINLLFDAMRKTIILIKALCDGLGLPGWRQSSHLLKKVKELFRTSQQLKRSTSKDDSKKEKREQLIIDAHLAYLKLVESLIVRAKETLLAPSSPSIVAHLKIEEIKKYITHAERQIDQIRRRVVEGETIPHNEKVFSLFEEHTEWISKGKAGVSQELGLKVCVVKDQFGFILHHRVMQKETDDQIAVRIIQETKDRFNQLSECSFDQKIGSKPLNVILEKFNYFFLRDLTHCKIQGQFYKLII